MKTYTLQDIRELEPYYDPSRYLPDDWQGTAIDVLRVTECPAKDRLWVASHWIDDRTLRLFAVWCARKALALIDNPDPRSVNACDVAERFANGAATIEELAAARDAAKDAARDAAWVVRDAARDAAWVAPWVAAWVAPWDAAWVAARDAAWVAARVAPWFARVAARDAAWVAQIDHLIEMLSEDMLSIE